MSSPTAARIIPTPQEERLFSLLLATCAWIREERAEALLPVGTGPTLRIAGGWVRDKLLGHQSQDIDVTIDVMKGEAFALLLQEYTQSPSFPRATTTGNREDGPTAPLIKTVATIAGNPERSKHLETATAQVLGFDLDFVHLRTEEYTTSRTPVSVGFGTPLEDALRRDITINALFYNLHTQAVEDCTGQGLEDLRQGLVRTPLDPVQTFTDDPLRILRCVRFATRFGYALDPSIQAAAQQPDIQRAFRNKISRERVGIEIGKMMASSAAARAIRLLHDFGYEEGVFAFPPAPTPIQPTGQGVALQAADEGAVPWDPCATWATPLSAPSWRDMEVVRVAQVCEELVHAGTFAPFHLASSANGSESAGPTSDGSANTDSLEPGARKLLLLACALLRAQGFVFEEKKKAHPVPRFIMLTSLKLSVKESDTVCALLHHVTSVRRAVAAFAHPAYPAHDADRGQLGHWVRSIGAVLKDQLPALFYLALALDQVGQSGGCAVMLAKSPAEMRDAYTAFLTHLQMLQLLRAYELRPVLDGKAVSRILGIPPGKQIKEVLERILDHQLRHPELTPREMEAWLRATYAPSPSP